MSLRLAIERSLQEVGGQVVSSGKKKEEEKKKKGTKRKSSTVSSSSESSTDQQTTDNESSITSNDETTSSSTITTLPNTKSISSTISTSNTIETISPSTSTAQPPTTLLSSSTTTNPAQHIVSNRQGRGALSRHITEGLQNQAGTPFVDLLCSVLLTDSDGRPQQKGNKRRRKAAVLPLADLLVGVRDLRERRGVLRLVGVNERGRDGMLVVC